MLQIIAILVSIIGTGLAASPDNELPNGLMPCTKSDPKLDECLKTSLQSIIPYLANGVPSLGLFPIDPFRIISLEIDQGAGPVSIKLTFRDLDISNIGTARINGIIPDLDNKKITLDVDFEKSITLDSNYEVKGKVMVLPITGNGRSKISLDNLKAKISANLRSVVRNGNTFMEIQELSFKFTTSRMHIKLENLFNGDKVLGDNMNTFLNENWKDILGELQSSIENAMASVISEVAKQVFSRVPLNQVLKD